jgi:predicted nuclease with TOPRIM domain
MIETELRKENNDLKKKFANLQTKNEQIAEAHQKLEKDTSLQKEMMCGK